MLLESVPVVIGDTPFTGDGPSFGVGNEPDNPLYGEQEYLTGLPSVTYKRLVRSPQLAHAVEFSGPVYYPVGDDITHAAAPTIAQFQRQDAATHEPFRLVDSGFALGAPPVITSVLAQLGKA